MHLRPVLCAAALAAAVLPTATAGARPDPLPQQHGRVDLRRQASVTIVSAKMWDGAGHTSASAGDVNGDGIDDVIVGAPGVDGPGRPDAGAAYVVFGRRSKAAVRRASLTARGFRILGPVAHGGAGLSVAPAGDVDGDGLDDVVVGTNGGSPAPGQPWRDGTAWIVRGKRDGATVDLALPDAPATKLTGPPSFGMLVAGGRDVDGDGRPDVVVAASRPDMAPGHSTDEAGVFVIRGGAAIGSAVDVRDIGDRGIAIRGIAARADRFANALALVQDMNGDGRAEVAIGFQVEGTSFAPGQPPPTPSSVVLARVVYGRAAPGPVDVSGDLGTDGFVVRATGFPHALGWRALAGGGDVNGDGRGDLALGDAVGNSAHVLFGGQYTGIVDVGGAHGLTIAGPPRYTLGSGVAIVGDVNGDGLADVLTGDQAVRALGRHQSGAAYVVFGRRTPGRVAVAHLGRGGFWIAGANPGDGIGDALAPAGDFNGDGRADLLIGAAADRPWDHRGVAYIVYGFGGRG